ncbi:MAG: molecular chaperone HtpG, partial [Planctomycetes bacterium]|nr:molecular chaperone HtpG [Planctomycetota bacterium]
KKQLIKKTLELLESVAADKPEDYEKLWSLFGKVLKEGIYHDEDHRERLAKLARFASDRQETTSLSDYVSRMADGQDSIYYLLGPSRNAVEGSPHGEALRRRGYEVLYLTDLVDEFALQALNEFDGKPLVSAAAANLDLADDASETDASKKERQASEEALEPLLERVKSILDDQVAEVRASRRLTESPCCLVVPVGGIHAHVERFLRSRDDGVPAQKRIFELNPEHGVVKRLNAMLQQGEDDKLGEWVYMLYDGALLAEGSPIADAPSYAKRVTRLMGQALGGE